MSTNQDVQLPVKNTGNNSKGNISPTEPRNPTIASPQYSKTVGRAEDLKTNFMKLIQVLKKK